MYYNAIIHTPLGKLGICTSEQRLIQIDFLAEDTPLIDPKEKLIKHIVNELNHYFNNSTFQFNVSYRLSGTPFQQRVWRALSTLPVQTTITYGALAKKLKTSARAIGNACRANPLPIFIPCHRVVAQHSLGGYKGKEKKIDIKKWLLKHEISPL